jgi:hypothetical protein
MDVVVAGCAGWMCTKALMGEAWRRPSTLCAPRRATGTRSRPAPRRRPPGLWLRYLRVHGLFTYPPAHTGTAGDDSTRPSVLRQRQCSFVSLRPGPVRIWGSRGSPQTPANGFANKPARSSLEERRLNDRLGRVPRTTAHIGVSPPTTSEPPKRLWIRKFKVRVLARQRTRSPGSGSSSPPQGSGAGAARSGHRGPSYVQARRR